MAPKSRTKTGVTFLGITTLSSKLGSPLTPVGYEQQYIATEVKVAEA
jgi:hypothetical protein